MSVCFLPGRHRKGIKDLYLKNPHLFPDNPVIWRGYRTKPEGLVFNFLSLPDLIDTGLTD
jgi:hypothetical protein